MSEKIEEVAAGMYTAADRRVGTHLPWTDYAKQEPTSADYWRFLARAAITALRIPTERMISAGEMYERETLGEQYTDMIDEILAEPVRR